MLDKDDKLKLLRYRKSFIDKKNYKTTNNEESKLEKCVEN